MCYAMICEAFEQLTPQDKALFIDARLEWASGAISYAAICEAFEHLTPQCKALFMDARLAWASGSAICGEVRKRICEPLKDD